MKTFSSEFGQNYESYSFGYCNYALKEKDDRLSDIYGRGYLPYSGTPGVSDIFYMARSARVDLTQFAPSSENRRIAKKFDGNLAKEIRDMKSLDISSDFTDFCLTYFKERHGKQVMPFERLKHILTCGLITDIMIYHNNDREVVAYVFLVNELDMTHFWYSFYDLSYARQSLGLWLMLDAIRDAKSSGKKYCYLGTVYGEKALYKLNFGALEYWNGEKWNADAAHLKAKAQGDASRTVSFSDEWKST